MVDIILNLLLLGLATYRLSQMVSYDGGPFFIFKNARDYFYQRSIENPGGIKELIYTFISKLMRCPYCNGVWISFIHLLLLSLDNVYINFYLYFMAIAGIQCYLQDKSGGR